MILKNKSNKDDPYNIFIKVIFGKYLLYFSAKIKQVEKRRANNIIKLKGLC